jgi:hypothetical protein
MDTKRLARFDRPGHRVTGDRSRTTREVRNGPGWEFCHSIIDDHTRLAFTEIHPDERAPTVTAFVGRALQFFADHDIRPRRLQTDNAWTYIHNTSLRELLAEHGIQHRRIPAPHAQAQREGRALSTDPRRTRMGLRTALPQLTLPRSSTAHLAQPLQLRPQPQLALKPATHQPRSEPAEAQQAGEHQEDAAR